MTKQEAIEGLEMYERMCCFEPRAYWSKYDFAYKCYAKSLVSFVIARINRCDDEPIMVIRAMKDELDDIIENTKNEQTWDFCSTMHRILDDIILWLR